MTRHHQRTTRLAAARVYAYVAVTSRDSLAMSNAGQASEATQRVARQLFVEGVV